MSRAPFASAIQPVEQALVQPRLRLASSGPNLRTTTRWAGVIKTVATSSPTQMLPAAPVWSSETPLTRPSPPSTSLTLRTPTVSQSMSQRCNPCSTAPWCLTVLPPPPVGYPSPASTRPMSSQLTSPLPSSPSRVLRLEPMAEATMQRRFVHMVQALVFSQPSK